MTEIVKHKQMNAKVRGGKIGEYRDSVGKLISEQLQFFAVAKTEGYAEGGHDENNTYARFSPSAQFNITVANPALFGMFDDGTKEYYVHFEEASSK
jgi:hypothetical protein